MKNEVYDLVPQWIKDGGDYSIMVGDDIDSLTTAMVLRKVFGWEINWFYDFHNVYVMDKENKKERVGVDMALEKGKTIDNHTVLLRPNDYVNNESVNMNTFYKVSRENYTSKYAMSTLLTAWSLLGLPLPKTDEGKKILLAIDSSFKGHYTKKFKDAHDEWLIKLGFEELIDFLAIYTKYDELNETMRERYGLSKKIFMNKAGQLVNTGINLEGIAEHLDLEIELPHCSFELVRKLHRGNINIRDFERQNNGKPLVKNNRVFSFALTYRDSASFTMF